jgi:hypothetical protein
MSKPCAAKGPVKPVTARRFAFHVYHIDTTLSYAYVDTTHLGIQDPYTRISCESVFWTVKVQNRWPPPIPARPVCWRRQNKQSRRCMKRKVLRLLYIRYKTRLKYMRRMRGRQGGWGVRTEGA